MGAMRNASDRLCREYGLSVIENPKQKAKHYGEWRAEKEGKPTYLGMIKADVDEAIAKARTEKQFFHYLKEKGYSIKFGKDITVRAEVRDRGMKLARNLGEEYTIESIRRRILTQKVEKPAPPAALQEKKTYVIRVHGNLQKTRKIGGLRGLYLHYCYLLGILPKNRPPVSPKQVHMLFREDLIKLDTIAKETRLLCHYRMERVKRAYVRTKETVENAQPQEKRYASPTEYAEDKTERGVDRAAHEAAHQARKQGSRLVDKAKEKHRISKETKEIRRSARGEGSSPAHGEPYQPKEQIRKKAQEQAGRKAAQKKAAGQRAMQRASQSRASQQRAAQIRELPKQTIKTIDRGEKTVKTVGKTGQTVKDTGKGTIKSAAKSVKTAGQTAEKTVKTTKEAAKTAKAAAKASVKTAEKTARAARQAAKAAEQTAKAAAKATASAVKAVIAGTKALISAIAAGGWVAVLILTIVLLFGGLLCMVGGGNFSTVSPVSAEVEAYPLCRPCYDCQIRIIESVKESI